MPEFVEVEVGWELTATIPMRSKAHGIDREDARALVPPPTPEQQNPACFARNGDLG